MNKVLTTVLLIFTLMSTEVNMATLAQSGAARTAARPVTSGAARPAQQQQQNVPAWLQGAYNQPAMASQPQPTQPPSNKNARDQLANAGNKRTNALNPAREDRPAWMPVVNAAIQTGSSLLAGPAGIPSLMGQAYGYLSPYLASLLPENKGNDQLAPGSPNKDLNRLGRLSGRNMFGEGVGPGTLDPSLWNQAGDGSGFGSSYGGNWRGRGGGGGGGGWGSNYGNADNYPAWLKIAMGLNSWNIK